MPQKITLKALTKFDKRIKNARSLFELSLVEKEIRESPYDDGVKNHMLVWCHNRQLELEDYEGLPDAAPGAIV